MPKQHPLTDIGQEMSDELDNDAKVNAQELFGDTQPDAANRPDSELAARISALYHVGDRRMLTRLAQANPHDFLRVWKSLGGNVPPEQDMEAQVPPL